MEMLMGKQFKMPVLEEMIKTMRVGERSQFTAIDKLCANYPFISKAYRQFASKDTHNDQQPPSGHCCGHGMQQHGLGYPDLDELVKKPQELTFVIELIKVEQPESYEKDYWEMEEHERVAAIPKLRAQGNELYKQGQVDEASEKYAKALGILEQLQLKEKPGEEEWNAYDRDKVPLLANYAQCKMIQKDYYAAIELNSEVLKREPDNVKALFRRAKAHAAVWNAHEAKNDFDRVRQLDPSLDKIALKEIKALEAAEKAKQLEEKTKFAKMF